jgi:hypothetical protein
MKEFKRTTYLVNIYGDKVELTPPTYLEMRAFQSEIEKKKDDENLVFEFLEKRGLKREIAESMEPQHLHEIINLFGEKKS